MSAKGHINTIESISVYINKRDHLPCWLWMGASLANGYGKVTVNYKTLLVHRFVYESLVCSIPNNMQIDHICCNKLCCNPEHLEVVTLKINMERRAAKLVYCANGHAYNEANIYIRRDGRRQCRACNREIWGRRP